MRARAPTLGLLTAAAVLIGLQAPRAQEAPAVEDQPPDGIEEVVVRGRRMSEIDDGLRIFIQDFIGEVVAKPPGRGYARWGSRVCVGVQNLESGAAQYLVDRISALVLEVGLEVGEPGCGPDVVIIFATDARNAATYMVENHPLLFRPAGLGNGDMTLSRAELADFAESERPVRWWHVSMPVDSRTGNPAIGLPGQGTPVVSVAGPSRIHDGIVDELQRVFVIVDATKLNGTTWQQIGDYLAVVALAQIDPDTNPAAFDSILNLFTNPRAYSGLTDWDRAYMRALYAFQQERRPSLQTGALVGEMVRDPAAQR